MRYCSVECQKRHRRNHQEFCRMMGSLPLHPNISTNSESINGDNGNIPPA